MHIYHYANYEIAACRRLMGRYATREHELDELLRHEVFVDLYVVVQQGLQIGEPRYSIKNVERLYRSRRDTDVVGGGESVVAYDAWRDAHATGQEGDSWQSSALLKDIRDYNIDDCNSTQELVDWLRLRQAEHGITPVESKPVQESLPTEAVTELVELRDSLLQRASVARKFKRSDEAALAENLAGFLEFHRREDKPVWWRFFNRLASNSVALLDDPACLAQCMRTEREPFKLTPRSRNLAYEYRFDTAQPFKAMGSSAYLHGELTDDGRTPKVKVIKEESDFAGGLVVIQHKSATPQMVTLISDELVPSRPIPAAIQAVVAGLDTDRPEPCAILDFLTRAKPRLREHKGDALAGSYTRCKAGQYHRDGLAA
jgi:uncharacterized protein